VLLGHAHVNILALSLTAPVKDRVGEVQSGSHECTATGIVDTVTKHDSLLVVKEVTRVTCWADVVRKRAAASNVKNVPAVSSKATADIGKRTRSLSVLKRSFSQNNPVNGIKV
jgi:hypothetical protein